MEPCNLKITIIIEDLDKPGTEPTKVVDQMRINGIEYSMSRSATPEYKPGKHEVDNFEVGPFMGRFIFIENRNKEKK